MLRKIVMVWIIGSSVLGEAGKFAPKNEEENNNQLYISLSLNEKDTKKVNEILGMPIEARKDNTLFINILLIKQKIQPQETIPVEEGWQLCQEKKNTFFEDHKKYGKNAFHVLKAHVERKAKALLRNVPLTIQITEVREFCFQKNGNPLGVAWVKKTPELQKFYEELNEFVKLKEYSVNNSMTFDEWKPHIPLVYSNSVKYSDKERMEEFVKEGGNKLYKYVQTHGPLSFTLKPENVTYKFVIKRPKETLAQKMEYNWRQ